MKMIALYRIAESKNKYNRNKPEWATNEACLKNFLSRFVGDVVVFGDRLDASKEMVKNLCTEYKATFRETTQHGNAQSFNEVAKFAMDNYNDSEIVYFVEDDYIHRKGFSKIIAEGLREYDYVSMYDHPDKYDGRDTVLGYTTSTHWQEVISTTMTFATKVKTLKEDWPIFEMYTDGDHPHDHYIFSQLNGYRTIATPIPSYSTHCVTEFISPIIDWSNEVE